MPNGDHEVLRVAADLAILTVRNRRLQALVIERRNEPFAGRHALPGGFLRPGEDVRQAAVRELREETGLDEDAESLHLELLSVYSAPDRDPRGRVVSVTFLALSPDLSIPEAGSDARLAFWGPVETVCGRLAFDHDQILGDAVERARARLEHTTLATAFCGQTFTMGDLRTVYEVVWGMPLDPRNFSRKVLRTQDFVQPTGGKRVSEIGRPATLYERGSAQVLSPPLMRNNESSSAAVTPPPVPTDRHISPVHPSAAARTRRSMR